MCETWKLSSFRRIDRLSKHKRCDNNSNKTGYTHTSNYDALIIIFCWNNMHVHRRKKLYWVIRCTWNWHNCSCQSFIFNSFTYLFEFALFTPLSLFLALYSCIFYDKMRNKNTRFNGYLGHNNVLGSQSSWMCFGRHQTKKYPHSLVDERDVCNEGMRMLIYVQ